MYYSMSIYPKYLVSRANNEDPDNMLQNVESI